MSTLPTENAKESRMGLAINEIETEGYERVIEAIEPESGLHALIAVHNTRLGPSLGGTRMYPYASREEALTDVLRLAKGMTYKSAVAEIGLGGGKSVLIGDPTKDKTPELLRAFGQAVDTLEGLYICAEDMGITPEDLSVVHETTPYVSALKDEGYSGDPGPFTAWGVYRGIQATANKLWGSDSLEGKTIAIQGMGSVGARLAHHLFWAGANVIVADINDEKAESCAREMGGVAVDTRKIHAVNCDIFAPCAIGGIINDSTLPELRCQAIAGAANNQLLEAKHGQELRDRDILYAPDYVINAGGIMNVAVELEKAGYNAVTGRNLVNGIYKNLTLVFEIAEREEIPTSEAADRLAEQKLAGEVSKRTTPLKFH